MLLKYMGKDGHDELKSGEVYNVKIRNEGEFIVVRPNGFGKGHWERSYKSPHAFAYNWRKVKGS